MQTTHFKFILRKPKVLTDPSAVYLYCNINQNVKYYSCGVKVPEKYWSDKDQCPKPGCPNYGVISVKLASIFNNLSTLIMQRKAANKSVSLSEISNLFSEGRTSTNLIDWMQKHLDNFAGKYTAQSLKTYRAQLGKLKAYSSTTEFETIDINWWHRYEKYLIDRGNCETTRHKAFKHLKTFLNKAVEAGIIDRNPWQFVKVKAGESDRQYLTIEELKLIEKTFDKLQSKKLINTGKAFLFSCYTGLRYSDVKALQWQNIQGEYIVKKMQKTQKSERLPMNMAAQLLLPERSNGKVFKVYSNQKINQYVKELVNMAGIDKSISFHCARHTFATISLELSGDIATVSKLLGHSAISTTQIYAKVLDQNKVSVINLWNSI